MKLALWSTTLLAALAPATGMAQDQQVLYVRALAATCANCHGTNGNPTPGSAVPRLAGMPRQDMIASLQALKAGTRQATVMHQLAKGYSDAQITQLADHFAALPK